jgi:hypothetical protein
MTAAEIFKKAGLEQLIDPALIGAGVGSLGMGAASYLNNDDEDASMGDKLKGALGSALKGGLLGAGAGAAFGGAKQMFNQVTEPSPNVQSLLQSSPTPLDKQPFSYNHPIQSMFSSMVNMPTWLASTLGGAAGLKGVHSARGAGQTIADRVLATQKPNTPVNPVQAAQSLIGARGDMGSAKASDRVLNGLQSMLKNTGTARRSAIEHLMRQSPSALPMGTPGDAHNSALRMVQADQFKGLGSGAGAQAVEASKIVKSLQNPKTMGLARYGAGGILGAAAAPLGLGAIDKAHRGILKSIYPEEQLKLWSELAK